MQQFLKSVYLFTQLPNDDLDHLSKIISEIFVSAGDIIFTEGDAGEEAYILKDGQVEVFKQSDDEVIILGTLKTGDVLGEMSLLQTEPRTASARAITDGTLLALNREHFNTLLESSSAVAIAILHTVIARLRTTEGLLRQKEKLAQLGTITTSVADELDGPASHAQLNTDQLRRVVEQLAPIRHRLHQLEFTDEQLTTLFELESHLHRRSKHPLKLDPFEQQNMELHLETVLTGLGIADAMNLAPMLVGLGYDEKRLRSLATTFTPEQLTVALVWLSKAYQMYSLFEKISRNTARVADIVEALKTYSALDTTPLNETDIHDELEDALVMLRNKLKAGVTIERIFDKSLPPIQAYGDELMKIWGNLVDNSVQAMQGQGKLTLRTYQQNSMIVVEVEDDGSGIEPDIQERIFEPFFSTGEGMGLGLHITQRIVEKHNGTITFQSLPHPSTCFTVKLPINQR